MKYSPGSVHILIPLLVQLYPLAIHLLLDHERLMLHHLDDGVQVGRAESFAQLRQEGMEDLDLGILRERGVSAGRDEMG